MDTFFVEVGFTTVRPVVPDQLFHWVAVAASSATEAQLIAAQMVGGGAEMVTSTRLLWVEI